MTDLDKMARELLAAEWRKLPEHSGAADDLESGCELPPIVGASVAAIRAALLTAPPGYVLVPVEPTHMQLDAALEGSRRGGLYGAYVAAIASAPEVE